MNDMLADIDARNIAVNMRKNPAWSLSSALKKYYAKQASTRYTTFVNSYGGLSKLQNVVDSYTINAWDPITSKILRDSKISKITDDELQALNNGFMNYIKDKVKSYK